MTATRTPPAGVLRRYGQDDHVHLLAENPPKVTVLLRLKRRLCGDFHRAPVHRTAAHATLKAKDSYAVSAILTRPERRGLPRTWSSATLIETIFDVLPALQDAA